MREMRRIRVGMRGMEWEYGCGESAWECGKSGWKYGKFGYQDCDAGNEGGNLSVVVEMT